MHRYSLQVALLVLSLLLPMPSTAQNLPGDDPRWSRLDTAHFIFISQLEEARTREMAYDLERLHAVLSMMTPDGELTSPNITYIYLFEGYDDFRPFMLRFRGRVSESVGYFAAHPHANFAALNGDPDVEPTRLLYSQYIHQLLAEQLPQLPLWFRQGLAEYYSTFQADERGAKLGLPSSRHTGNRGFLGNLMLVDGNRTGQPQGIPMLSMAQVLQLERSPSDPQLRNRYLAYCWGIMHYLLSDEERQQQARDFARRVVLGTPHDEAFAQSFPFSAEDLQTKVNDYLGQHNFKYLRLAMALKPSEGALYRPLPRHEALFYLGDLILHANSERHLDAANYFEASLAAARSLNIDFGPAHAALGEVAQLTGDMESASRSYALAVEHADGDALVNFLYGQSLLATLNNRRPDNDDAKQRLQDAVTALQTSTTTRPEFAEAWASLGFAYGLEETPSGNEVDALSKALSLLPGRSDIALNLLLAHAKQGQREAADSLYRRLQWMGTEASDLDRAQEILLQMDYREANRLVRKENRLADAIALFARIQATSRDASLRERAAERLKKFAAAQTHNRFATLYVTTSQHLQQLEAQECQTDEELHALVAKLDELSRLAQPGLQQTAVDSLRQRHQGAQSSCQRAQSP